MSYFNYSLTVFSESGELQQLKNAAQAADNGLRSLAIKSKNGIVFLSVRSNDSPLLDDLKPSRVFKVCETIGAVYSGIGADARVLFGYLTKIVMDHKLTFKNEPTVSFVVRELGIVMQRYTQRGGVRPFGCSLLVGGLDVNALKLYKIEASGQHYAVKANANGKNGQKLMDILTRRFSDEMELTDAMSIALIAAKDTHDSMFDENSVDVCVYDNDKRQFETVGRETVGEIIKSLI